MQLTISRMTRKEITTSKGAATKLNFQAGNVWYSCFEGSWNQDWENGMTIDVDPERIVVKESNGKKYTNIVAPSKEKAAGAQSDARVIKALETMWHDLQEVKKSLRMIKQHLGIEEPEPEPEPPQSGPRY